MENIYQIAIKLLPSKRMTLISHIMDWMHGRAQYILKIIQIQSWNIKYSLTFVGIIIIRIRLSHNNFIFI